MRERAERVEQTRRRIVRATLDLHAEQGISGTSWDDIAERAGVGVGTVYRHFRSLDELLPACGALTWEKLALPGPDEVAGLFTGARSRRDRVARMVRALFAIYARGEAELENVRRERDLHPVLDEAYRHVETALDRLVAAGVGGSSARSVRLARALTDVRTWRALREQGIDGDEAIDVVTELIASSTRRR